MVEQTAGPSEPDMTKGAGNRAAASADTQASNSKEGRGRHWSGSTVTRRSRQGRSSPLPGLALPRPPRPPRAGKRMRIHCIGAEVGCCDGPVAAAAAKLRGGGPAAAVVVAWRRSAVGPAVAALLRFRPPPIVGCFERGAVSLSHC